MIEIVGATQTLVEVVACLVVACPCVVETAESRREQLKSLVETHMREILIAAQDALNTFMLAHHFGENRIPEIDIVGHGELALAAIGCIQRMATDGFHKIFQTGIEYREAVAVGGQHGLHGIVGSKRTPYPVLLYALVGKKSHAVADANRNRRQFEQQYYEILMYRIGETAVARGFGIGSWGKAEIAPGQQI